MARATNPQAKNTRSVFRIVIRETERLLNHTIGKGKISTLPYDYLKNQVALNTGFPVGDIQGIVSAYIQNRNDLYIAPGKAGGIRVRS